MKNPFIVQTILDLANISHSVNKFFKDEEKTTIWLNTENPHLGGKEPIEMIFSGQSEKLKDFIESALSENKRDDL